MESWRWKISFSWSFLAQFWKAAEFSDAFGIFSEQLLQDLVETIAMGIVY